MKIGVLTFFNAHNYGAVLQAYAIKKYVESQGFACQIINYRNKYIEKNYPRKLIPRIRKKDIISPLKIKNNFNKISEWRYSHKEWDIQYNKFENFINTSLLENDNRNWKQQVAECNLIIIGSDQVWERNIIGSKDTIYIGDFAPEIAKISYAASCYSEESTMDERLIKSLKHFKAISVREDGLREKIEKLLGSGSIVKTVCDPVFLPDVSVYNQLIMEETHEEYQEPYTLFYMVSENEILSDMSDFLIHTKGKKIIEIHYFKNKKNSKPYQRMDVGPVEFLRLVKRADYIISNSFHGIAFAIIFRKQFIAVSDNMRLKNLLEQTKLLERCCTDLEQCQNIYGTLIDYRNLEKNISDMQQESRNYLNNNLFN